LWPKAGVRNDQACWRGVVLPQERAMQGLVLMADLVGERFALEQGLDALSGKWLAEAPMAVMTGKPLDT